MRIENIIFDLDGTLVDSLPGIEYAVQKAINSVLTVSMSVGLRPLIGPPICHIFRKIFPNIEEQKLDMLVREFRKNYDSIGWQKTVLFDGVKDILGQLKNAGINRFLVTSKPKIPTWNILNQLQLNEYFLDIISPDVINPPFLSKAEGVAYLINVLRLDVSKTLMIGDTQEDAKAAKACGIQFVAVRYGYGSFQDDLMNNIKYKINNISELWTIISEEDK